MRLQSIANLIQRVVIVTENGFTAIPDQDWEAADARLTARALEVVDDARVADVGEGELVGSPGLLIR